MELPGVGLICGEWDLRGSEKAYIGNVALRGKTVLEIGPGSGYLTFWMEKQGAQVTAYDLDETHSWDLVPFSRLDLAAIDHERKQAIKKLNNSWWFARERLGSSARCAYGSVYDLDKCSEQFDTVMLTNVLLHLRDPLSAIEAAAKTCKKVFVVTDVSERQFAGSRPDIQGDLCLHFIPRASANAPVDGWWYIPSALTVEMLRVLGFSSIDVSYHTQKFKDGHSWEFYTVVGTR